MKSLLLFTLFFFTLSQFVPPGLPPADFSGPGQIYHPASGKCLSHSLGVAEAAGSTLTVSLVPCEGEQSADEAQKPYRRTIWKFQRYVKTAAPSKIDGPELPSDSTLKAYIVPFSPKYGPNAGAGSGNFVLGVDKTANALTMIEAAVADLLAVWEVTYKKSDNTFFGNYYSFNPYFYLRINPVAAIKTAETLETTTGDLTLATSGNIQLNYKLTGTTVTLPLEAPTVTSATVSIPTTSMFVFRKVAYSAGDDALLKDTFVFKKTIDVTSFASPDGTTDKISIVLGLDPAETKAKPKGIHNTGFFSIQAPGSGTVISALCTTKYNNTFGLSWDFFENYDFGNKQLNHLFVPPIDDNAATRAIQIVATPLQLVNCGFLRTDAADGSGFKLEGKIGYIDTNTRNGFYWNAAINVYDQLSASNTYIDNPDSHFWFYDQSQTVNVPSFGRIIVHHVDTTDLKPLASGAAVPTTLPSTIKTPYTPVDDNNEILVRDYLIYQLVLQNSTADSYTISNVRAFVFQRKLNPSGLFEDAGAVELTIKEVAKGPNNYNFTLPLEKVPTGDYKLLLQYNIAAATSKRILAEEDRKVIKTEAGSTVVDFKVVNDALAGDWMRFFGLIAVVLALVLIV